MKKLKTIIKLQIPAGGATPAPPVGPALGQHGLNIQEFCVKFNEATKNQKGDITPVEISVYEDRTYNFKLKTTPAAELIKAAAGIQKGSGAPQAKKVGKISKSQLQEIAERKMQDLNAHNIGSAMRIIEGTARQMGVEIV